MKNYVGNSSLKNYKMNLMAFVVGQFMSKQADDVIPFSVSSVKKEYIWFGERNYVEFY